MTRIRPVSYADYRRHALSGDVLLCRAGSLEGRVITRLTGMYSHASLCGWINAERRDDPLSSALMIVEAVQHNGTRIIPLSSEIRRYSGLYDVYRPKDSYPRLASASPYDGPAAFAWSCRGAGSAYGWCDLSRVLCRRYGFWPLRLLAAPENTADPGRPRDCAHRVASALRFHGGPILREWDADVVPSDFADPKRFEYRGTLFGTTDEAMAVAEVLDACRALEASELDLAENGGEAA